MKENSNLIIYKNEDGNIDISVKLENETIWLTQKTMAELFECSTDNISLHLKKRKGIKQKCNCRGFLGSSN